MPTALPLPIAAAVPRGQWLARLLLVALAYFLTGRLALMFPHVGPLVSLLWAPAGIALAALLRWGRGQAAAIAIGAFAVNLAAGAQPPVALAIAAGNTLAPWLAAEWLQQRGFGARLESRRDLWLLLGAGAGAAALLAALNGAFSLWLGGVVPPGTWLQTLGTWWMGDALGLLVAGVPLLTLNRRSLAHALAHQRWKATLLLSAGVLASAVAAFMAQSAHSTALTPLVFVPHVLLCWLVLRRGIAFASLTVLLLSVAAATATAQGAGPFHADTPAQGLALLWGYLATLATSVLVATALTGELSSSEERWQLALEGCDIGVADWELPSGRGFTSRRWRSLLGDADGAATGSLTGWLVRIHEDDRPRILHALQGLQAEGNNAFRHEVRLLTASGACWFEVHALVPERAPSGRPARLVVSLSDVSERRGAAERQRLSANLFQHLHEGLLITDGELRVLDVNPTYSQITGLSRHDVLGQVPALLQPAADAAGRQQQSAMWASLRATGTWRGELVQRRRNGDPCALHLTISTVQNSDGQVRNHVLVISDITEQRLQRERLERQAHFDELTRLPNRTRLSQMLSDAMAACEREGCLLAVCYLDLDHFKPVNDRFGHAAGDRLLVELASRLRGALRANAAWSDAAARLGGDEFVLLLRAGTLDEARLAVERVLRVVGQPYAIGPSAEAVQITASVGATVYPLDRCDADTLLRHADHAMYGAKQSGRNGYLFFDPEHSRRTEERVMAIGRVQEALDNRELVLHYQPKVDMRRGVVLGMEALIRWNHPEQGLLPPAQFLPLIEHTGLSARVGDWVLEQALEQLAHWQLMGLDLSVSVNVSARHLQEPDFAQRLTELLARHHRSLGPKLELEVLETAALADVGYTSALLDRCRRLGVRFSLDDFGTGYSTLTYLKQLPVDVLKIDRSFVHNMLNDPQDLAIVEGVIGLARTFGCSVVAEGVESPAQARTLIELGCDIGQGLGLSAAMPADEVYRWVRDHKGLFALPPATATVVPLHPARL
ncbi:bifunctional diguanylate cyclase/phosphodiesterase [Ideonella sp. BN130291]|uniref:bifunctional diguanylate cyclase/phosphodiesterase n=1 Tax=Ideonella sp. BN130291 TaxID=3112940 RepID=UPI002E26D3A0|nr:EAL domain-containing protein [Ideonella sp. BN130291]